MMFAWLWVLKYLPFLGVLPKIIETGLEVVKPVLVATAEGLVWYLKKLWEGFLDVIDNIATILFVATLIAGTFLYVTLEEKQECKQEKAQIVYKYKNAPQKSKPVEDVSPFSNLRFPWEW